MNDPLQLRIADKRDPGRADKFETVLTRRKANAPDVIRGLIDAYIESDGQVPFPVGLIERGNKNVRGSR